LPNALFLVGDALAALDLFHSRLTELRITLPWGGLLRAILTGERTFALAVAGSLWRGGQLCVLVSLIDRDAPAIGVDSRQLEGGTILGPFERALTEVGMPVSIRRPATAADVADLGSTWAKRLRIPQARPAWVLRAAASASLIQPPASAPPPRAMRTSR
jgi:hypothetical protein